MEDILLSGGDTTIYLLHPKSPFGKAWLEEHMPEDAQRLGQAYAVEHRFIDNWLNMAICDGLYIRS